MWNTGFSGGDKTGALDQAPAAVEPFQGVAKMASFILEMQDETFAHDPQHCGYCIQYLETELNHYPGSGRTHWFVGRDPAEWGFCATALPLPTATSRGAGTHSRGH